MKHNVQSLGAPDHPLDGHRQDESGQVAAALNLMAARLKEREVMLAQARDEAISAGRLKSRLLANVSHDLRTPLSVILGYAGMLEDGAYGPLTPKQTDAMERILASTRRLITLIEGLLDQAQIEAGQIELHYAPFRPDELLAETRVMVDLLARMKGLALLTEIDPGLPDTLVGDRHRLEQILLNLVDNAIKFTTQGTVRARLCLDEQGWAMVVSDTGRGIPPKAQDFIFDPFRQVDDSLTREQIGVGLGLSIVHKLTSLMGGKIRLVSKLGQGSTFYVSLPLIPAEDARRDTMTQRLAFIVEDSLDLAEIFAEAIMAAGFATEIIARGDRALARLATTVPDVVLLDMHLPGVSGERILRRIRTDKRLAKTRVMIASADDAIAEALREQVDLTLLKPISYTQLRDLAARLRKEMDDAQ